MKLNGIIKDDLHFASKQTIKMSIPLVGSNLSTALNRFVGMLMIAQLGRVALAAGALISCTMTTLTVVAFGYLFSVGVVVGRAFGAGQPQEVGRIVRQGFLLAFILAIPLTLLVWNMGSILLLFGQEAKVVELTNGYFHGIAAGMLPMMWLVCLNQFVVGISRPQLATAWSVILAFLSILLGYLMLFGRCGFSKMGIAGVAYAYTFVLWVLVITMIAYFYNSKKYQAFKLFRFKREQWDFRYLKQLFFIGYPISIQFGAELIAFTLVTLMMGWLGESTLAAQQVLIQCNFVVIMLPYAISQASAVLVGQSLGRKTYHLTKEFGRAGVFLGLVTTGAIAVLYLFFPKMLISMFLDIHAPANGPVIKVAVMLMAIGAFSQIFDAIRNILTGALRGCHDTQVPMWAGVFIIWVIGLPLGYVLAFPLHLGPMGLALSYLLAFLVGAIILWRRFGWQVQRYEREGIEEGGSHPSLAVPDVSG